MSIFCWMARCSAKDLCTAIYDEAHRTLLLLETGEETECGHSWGSHRIPFPEPERIKAQSDSKDKVSYLSPSMLRVMLASQISYPVLRAASREQHP